MADSNPSITSIPQLAAASQILHLPWSRISIPLLRSFNSSLCTTSPWSTLSPFVPSSLIPIYTPTGGIATYRSSASTGSTGVSEHVSVGLGVSVGCKFLSASVSGQYDRDVLENKDAEKTSITASYRAGTVLLACPPKLTTEAIVTLKYNGGLPAFKARYGDYYLAGFNLGADAGVLASRATCSSALSERLSVTVVVQALFWSNSETEETVSTTSSRKEERRINGYYTLDGVYVDSGKQEGEVKGLMEGMEKLGDKVKGRLEKVLGGDCEDKRVLTGEACERLCEEGLVVELILMPVKTLREVMMWVLNDDVI